MEPYYHTYVAPYVTPYVEKAQPYVDRVKTRAYDPALAFTKENYSKHGAHRVAQAQQYGQTQWEKTVRPQFEKARLEGLKQYDAHLAPHVQKVWVAVEPYYTNLKNSAIDFYELEIRPAYKFAAPYAQRTYHQLHAFTVNTGLPYAHWGANLTWSFVSRQIWPRIQILYGENVEPQVMKITQRLGRYKDEKKLEAAVESIAASSKASSASASASSVSSSVSSLSSSIASSLVGSTTADAAGSTSSAQSAEPSETEQTAAEQFADDLKLWEEQVAKAVQEGSDHLRERVQDICDKQLEHQVNGVGKALIIRLEESSQSVFKTLKSRILSAVESLPEDASSELVASVQDHFASDVREGGQTIKSKAQSVREWKQGYDKETIALVDAAANSTLETIDNIQDLRLQDIGRRWASNEGITHKDWSKYNELKKTSSQWRNDVEAVASKNERLTEAKKAASDIEEQAMSIAEESAQELARLKKVGQWKIEARDASDDFNTKYVPAAAARAKQQVVNKVSDASEAVAGTTRGSAESLSSIASSKAANIASGASEAAAEATFSVESAASKASENIIGTGTGNIESAASKASERILGTSTGSIESAASEVSKKVVGTHPGFIESAASEASKSVVGSEPGVAEQAATKVSEAVIGGETPAVESVLSAANQNKDQVAASIKGTPAPMIESVASDASSSLSSVASVVSEAVPGSSSSSVAEKASKKVWGGAMAQAIPVAHSIVLDDDIVDDQDETYSAKIQSIVSKAGDQASVLTQAVQDAIKPTTTQGKAQAASSYANEQYLKAIEAASSMFFEDEETMPESMARVASERYSQAVSA